MQFIRTTFKAMGCMNEIVAGAPTPEQSKHAMELATREVLRIEAKYSRYRKDHDSIVFRINQSAGRAEPVACDPETVDLLRFASELHAVSGGLFDITSGVLRRAWDFSKPVLPASESIAPLLGLIGWHKVEFDRQSIRLPSHGMEIDFGGFGKEYAADRAAAMLTGNGIVHGYVNLGGDIKIAGPREDGGAWRFGVQDPRNPDCVSGNIELAAGALATSGDYEKFITIDGTNYCHILNPRTGFPPVCWRSVSVVGVSALAAGAMSTIAMLKEADALFYLKELNCKYLLVDAAGRRFTNSQTF